jgi:3-isopropylmalate/(R)-2-methylmalate dehydratase large subunit
MHLMQTLSQKVWDRHVVHDGGADEPDVLFIDLHLVHEVTSPQAFDGLRLAKRTVRRPDLTLATMDHNVPTTSLLEPVKDPISKKQMDVLAANCEEFGIRLYPMARSAHSVNEPSYTRTRGKRSRARSVKCTWLDSSPPLQ